MISLVARRPRIASLGLRTLSSKPPYALLVNVTVKPERRAEFLKVLAADAVGTRAEPECLRFDLLQDEEDENKFTFYSVYKSAGGLDFHRSTAHYKAWSDFRASGGIEKQEASKAFAIDWTG